MTIKFDKKGDSFMISSFLEDQMSQITELGSDTSEMLKKTQNYK